MITPSFALTATERVLPKLALDFTTASLDARVTFTRTTGASNPATYVNSSGNIASATNNQPRFDYDPVTLVCKGLLIEESRQNKFIYSTDLRNAAWTANRCGLNASAGTSPDGTNNAFSLIEDSTASNTHYFYYATTSGWTTGAYTMSLYIKAKSNDRRVTFYQGFGGVAGSYVTFDPNTGTIAGTGGSATGTMTAAGNGWYRCTITYTTTSTTARFDVALNTATGVGLESYSGNGTSGVYVWGAQLESAAFATSYIPTTSAALTRNADVATMTGTNFSSWWTATTGASTVWLTPRSTSTLAYLSFDDNTANNKIVLANSTTSGQSKITSGGTLQATLTAGTITANATNKVGCSWNTNNCAGTANATAPATTASATIPTVTQARIGSDGTAYANAWIQKIMYWPQRITNNEVQAFTK